MYGARKTTVRVANILALLFAIAHGVSAFMTPVRLALGYTTRSFASTAFRGRELTAPWAVRRADGVRGLAATLPSNLAGKERLEKFIDDCALLGPVRFVCMTDGAILESVGSFDNLRYSDQPKGRYATVSEGNGFECHLNMDRIKSITMVTKKSPSGDYQLYITRFLDDAGGTVLSAMLHGVDGSYEPGAADYWGKLQNTFGAEQSVA